MVPDPVRHEIDGLRRALGDTGVARIAPHLTLVSPVNVAEADVPQGLELLRAAAEVTAPFELELGPVVTFHPVSPVVYLAVGGETAAVHQLRDRVFTRPFTRRVDHAYVPHVTLSEGLAIDRIGAAVAALADYRTRVVLDGLHLLELHRDEAGRRWWEPIADMAFRPRATVSRGPLEVELVVGDLLAPDVSAALLSLGTHRPDPPPTRARGLVIAARREGAVVGVAAGWTMGPSAVLEVVAVAAHARGEGVGSHLLAHFEWVCAERGADEVRATAPDEPAVLALLARRGFARYPSRTREAPVRLWRAL